MRKCNYMQTTRVKEATGSVKFFKPFPNLSWCNNLQSSAFVGCYAFAGCGNGHSLSVMSETNSRVISLTSHRSRGVKLLRQRGCHCRADAHRHSCPRFPPGLGVLVSGTCQRVRIYEVSAPREKARLIVGRMYAPP